MVRRPAHWQGYWRGHALWVVSSLAGDNEHRGFYCRCDGDTWSPLHVSKMRVRLRGRPKE